MTNGFAIISLDCEGKWGVADREDVGDNELLTDDGIRTAYDALIEILDREGVPATFAVVELFTWTRARILEGLLDELAAEHPYLRSVPSRIRRGDEGWSAPWLPSLLGDHHELASHGLSHVPWHQLSEVQAARELALIPADRRRTFVFPRNIVRHTQLLEAEGCLGYRTARPFRSRAASLLSEANIFQRSDVPDTAVSPRRIPAGFFINWLNGPRRLIPSSVTRIRARQILRDASHRGGVAHFWTHPENVVTQPRTLGNFKAIVEEVARARDRYGISVQTQLEYCQSLDHSQ